jgi:hypothetical protein
VAARFGFVPTAASFVFVSSAANVATDSMTAIASAVVLGMGSPFMSDEFRVRVIASAE